MFEFNILEKSAIFSQFYFQLWGVKLIRYFLHLVLENSFISFGIYFDKIFLK